MQSKSALVVKNLKDIYEGRKPWAGLFEIQGITPDEVKLQIEVNKKPKVINLSKHQLYRAYFDITEKVKLRRGHPTFESVNIAAHELLFDLYQEMGGGSTS
jgi:hypothetical protein